MIFLFNTLICFNTEGCHTGSSIFWLILFGAYRPSHRQSNLVISISIAACQVFFPMSTAWPALNVFFDFQRPFWFYHHQIYIVWIFLDCALMFSMYARIPTSAQFEGIRHEHTDIFYQGRNMGNFVLFTLNLFQPMVAPSAIVLW